MLVTRTKSFRTPSLHPDSLSNFINEFLLTVETEPGFEIVDIKHSSSAYGTNGNVGTFMTGLVIYKIELI